MTKKLQDLLDQINAKKLEVQNLAEADKLEEAKEAKKELEAMQDKFDILKDTEDDAPIVPVRPVEDHDAVKEFAAAARKGFRNAATDAANEGTGSDGGYTVPQDIQTRINKYKEAEFSLERLVDVERVSTNTGRRTYVSRAAHTGFSSVSEQGTIGKKNIPQFTTLSYSIVKYAGYLPVTNELLADSDANIADFLIDWLGKEDVATRNNLIIAQLAAKAVTTFTSLDDIKNAVNVTLGQAFAGSVQIITNDDGLQYLDTLKDENERYLLSPDVNPDSPFKLRLAIGANYIPVVVVPSSILANSGTSPNVYMPFYVGDFKEAVKIFDRQKLTIMSSNVASTTNFNAFEQDMTLFRAIERLHVVTKDSAAWVHGQIKK